MASLLSSIQAVMFLVFLFHHTATFPAVSRFVESDDSFVDNDRLSCKSCLFPRDSEDADDYTAEYKGCRRSELQTRQLGDLEFTNRQAELLKSKAKLSSLCSFLRRMQNSMKSGLTGDTERVNTLMKQHMCASVYQ